MYKLIGDNYYTVWMDIELPLDSHAVINNGRVRIPQSGYPNDINCMHGVINIEKCL